MTPSITAKTPVPRRPHSADPVLSILAFTYNHERWVAQALDSLLAQKTDFPIEILVMDDASTDGTVAIIKEYERQFPGLITGVYQTENQFSKGGFSPLMTLFKHAKGKYIAMCECDDYWIDPLKSQKQVELLEAHPECSMCVAQTETHKMIEGRPVYQDTFRGLEKDFLDFEDFAVGGCYLHTSTYVIPATTLRAVVEYQKRITITDTSLRFILLHFGPFVLLREPVSVYRVTGEGMWSGLDSYTKLKLEAGMSQMMFTHFEPKYRHYFAKRLLDQYLSLVIADAKRGRVEGTLENGRKFGAIVRQSSPLQVSKVLLARTFSFIRRVTN